VAPSFARAFFRNAINNGLALITAPTQGLSSGRQLCIDLGSGRITLDDQSIRQGTGLSDVLLDIVSSGGLLAYLKQHDGWPASQGRMSLTP
jgi:3-isopropylmalate dehydratase small subunit